MDVNWFKLSDDVKEDICVRLVEPNWDYLDRWMKQHYRAIRYLNSNNEFCYRFKDNEKYTEFCLKWM